MPSFCFLSISWREGGDRILYGASAYRTRDTN